MNISKYREIKPIGVVYQKEIGTILPEQITDELIDKLFELSPDLALQYFEKAEAVKPSSNSFKKEEIKIEEPKVNEV